MSIGFYPVTTQIRFYRLQRHYDQKIGRKKAATDYTRWQQELSEL